MANNPFGSQGFYRKGAVSFEFLSRILVPDNLQQVTATLAGQGRKTGNGYSKA